MVEATQEQPNAEAGTAQTPPQRRGSSIPGLIFFGLVVFMLTSHNGDELLARHQYQAVLQSLSYDLANYTAWQSGNASNFTMPDKDTSIEPLLSHFNVFQPDLDPSRASYYSNITGFLHGDAVYHNISDISPASPKPPWRDAADNLMVGANMTQLMESLGTWNWSASRKLSLSVVEKKPLPGQSAAEDVVLIHGRMEFTDTNIAEDLRLEFEGVHFLGNGSIYGFSRPTVQQIDIRLLPSLVPSDRRNDTAALVTHELSSRIEKLRTLIDDGVIDQDTFNNNENPKSLCPFMFFGQIIPADVPEALMLEFENELQKPTGVWTIKPPLLSVNGLLISKECGMIYELVNTEGLRSRAFFRKVTTYAGLASITYFVLLVLLSRQMARTQSPASISRISRWSFISTAIIDSVSFAGHITFAVVAQGRPSLSLIAPAFLACLLFVYEAQYALLIYRVQLPEDAVARQLQQTPPPVARPPDATPSQSDTHSVVTTAQSSTSAFMHLVRSVWQLLRTDSQSRFWFFLCIFLTFIVRIVLSPSLALSFVAILYSCFWLPQIFRSARRGRITSLSKEYIFGSTICRLFLVTYFLTCPRNVLDIEPRRWVHVLVAFVLFQVFVILLQQFFGPSFFLPQGYTAVQIHDYHPPIPGPDPESPERSLGDCAICMDAIFVDPPSPHGKSKLTDGDKEQRQRHLKPRSGGLLNAVQKGVGAQVRKSYSLAPCHHLFHTECLEKWLAIKNICPQCRRPLPPL